jgi:hypothetical protein
MVPCSPKGRFSLVTAINDIRETPLLPIPLISVSVERRAAETPPLATHGNQV